MSTSVGNELAQLQHSVMVAAYEAHVGGTYDPRGDEKYASFLAGLVVAENTDTQLQTPDQQKLAHTAKVAGAMQKAVSDGLVTKEADVEELTDALVLTPDINPSAAIKYLRVSNASKLLGRTVTPRELINAISLIPDFTDIQPSPNEHDESLVDKTPSLGRLIRAANLVGISLDGIGIYDDYSIGLIAASLASVKVRVSRSTLVDHPIDGPVSHHFTVDVQADTSGPLRDSSVNPAFSGEFYSDDTADAGEWY